MNSAAASATAPPPERRGGSAAGLGFASIMLGLEAAECLVLTEVVFFDRPRSGLSNGFDVIELYFFLVVATLVGQLVGILLVRAGRLRAGAIVQIASSLLHVPKGEGLIGVFGGLRALEASRSAAPSTDPPNDPRFPGLAEDSAGDPRRR